jgi:protein TonB
MIAKRLPIAALFGSAFTISVFWVLWTLVSGPIGESTLVEARRIEFTRMRQDTEAESRRDEKVELEEPPPPPEMPQIAFSASSINNNVATLTPLVDPNSALSRLRLTAGSDTDTIPLVRINPEYPPRALARGLEGYVVVQFTITETGTTKDITVVESSSSVFEDAAVRAVERYRYNPKIEGGVPVERVGIRVQLVFELSDEQ